MNTNNYTNDVENAPINIQDIIRLILQYKRLIGLVVSFCLMIGLAFAYLKPRQYEADVLLQVSSGQSVGLGKLGMAAALGMGGAAGSAASQIALIKSRYILEPVIKKLHLNVDVQYDSVWKQLTREKAVPYKNLDIDVFLVPNEQIKKPFYLRKDSDNDISLLDSHHQLIVSGKVGDLLHNPDHSIEVKINRYHADIGTEYILKRIPIEKVQKKLIKMLFIQEAGAKGMSGTGLISLKLKGNNPEQVVQTLNEIALTAERNDEKKKAHETQQMLSLLSKQIPISAHELEKSEQELNHYRETSGRIDYAIQTKLLINEFTEVDKKLTQLNLLKGSLQLNFKSTHPRLIKLNQKISSLQAHKRHLKLKLKSLPSSDQIAINLLRDVAVKKTLYTVLLKKIQELQVFKAGNKSTLSILAAAEHPEEPISRHLLAIGIFSIALGIFMSGLIIYVITLLNQQPKKQYLPSNS